MNKDFHLTSYEAHQKHYSDSFDEKKMNSWQRKDTVDYWRHKRMYETLDPLIESYPESDWLTIGDGRYGTDANYILTKGIKKVLASDISDTYLKIAKNDGFISDYKIENSEKLSFGDKCFDFVLCKEAYHHFPRPMIALYEMIRVAKKAVILIEPQDANILIPSRFGINTLIMCGKQVLKNAIKHKIGREIYYSQGNYEETGNYVYTISEREIEKVALGLNLSHVAFKSLNDYYEEGVEFEEISDQSKLFKKIESAIKKKNYYSSKGLAPYGLLISIIFNNIPNEICAYKLNQSNFILRELPGNPYLDNK